jgi:hypothetical protein
MIEFVDELENLVARGTRIPATGKILMDEAALVHAIEQLRAAAPDELRLGQRIAGERERILADARAQARRLTEEAQAQLNARLDDQAVVRAARERAREVQLEAEQRAAALRAEANQYVMSQLNSLEARLQRLLAEVQNGQRFLAQPPTRGEAGGGAQ